MNAKTKFFFIGSCLIVGTAIVVFLNLHYHSKTIFNDNDLPPAPAINISPQNPPTQTSTPPPSNINTAQTSTSSPLDIKTTFIENFDKAYTIIEAGKISESVSSAWWLSSGAYFYSANGVGSTILGSLSASDPWRTKFLVANPLDTDNGYYPQNIFRLVQRGNWLNFTQEAYFKIIQDNFSASPNRNESNGLLFFNRYQDSQNLYYTGIRVDGEATIKKKVKGVYYTLAINKFLEGAPYKREDNTSLLPKDTWIGLRSEVKTDSDGTVNIKLYVDNGKTGNWVLAAEAKDDGKSFGGAVLGEAGHGGIRTDFMDVEFSNYKIGEF